MIKAGLVGLVNCSWIRASSGADASPSSAFSAFWALAPFWTLAPFCAFVLFWGFVPFWGLSGPAAPVAAISAAPRPSSR